MQLKMTNDGVSESLVNLEFEVGPEQTFTNIPKEVHNLSEFNLVRERRKLPNLPRSSYAVMCGKAKISWKNIFEDFNAFAVAYREIRKNADTELRLQDIQTYMGVPSDQFPPIILLKDKDELIQIDGARRILAHLLANETEINVIIVISRKQIKTVLEPDFIQTVTELHTHKKWFKTYQDIIELGLKGSRSYSGRFPNILDFSILEDKVVAEFGCNNGMALFEAYYRGANRVVGFDFIHENVESVNLLAKRFGIPVEAHRIDFNDSDWLEQVKRVIPEWDYSVFLSVYRTKELVGIDGLMSGIWDNSREGMIFEGHGNPVLDSDEVYAKAFSKLENCKVITLPKGIIERPYDNGFRLKYLLQKTN